MSPKETDPVPRLALTATCVQPTRKGWYHLPSPSPALLTSRGITNMQAGFVEPAFTSTSFVVLRASCKYPR